MKILSLSLKIKQKLLYLIYIILVINSNYLESQ